MSALLDCLSIGRVPCTRAYKTFAEMAAHRSAVHGVSVEETYADVDEPMPEEVPSCAKSAATARTDPTRTATTQTRTTAPAEVTSPPSRPAATTRKEKPAEKPENRMATMARGVCVICKVGHGRAKCPKAGASPRGKPGRERRRAPSVETPSRARVDGVEVSIDVSLGRLEQHATALEAKAKAIRDAIAVLRKLA